MHAQKVVQFALTKLSALHVILVDSKLTISAFHVQKHALPALIVEIAVLAD